MLDSGSVDMPPCSSCERLGLSPCLASPSDSARCEACIRNNRPGCDVLGPSPSQLDAAGRRFRQADSDLEVAEEAAAQLRAELELRESKVRRLRRQRKVLGDQVYRMFRRGLKSLEELEKVEAEERRASELPSSEPASLAVPGPPTVASSSSAAEFDPTSFDWSSTDFSFLDPSPLVDPGVAGGTGEPSLDNPSGAP